VGDPTNLLVLLVYLQGAAVIFRLGRHHHRGPFCEGRGLTHALTDTAPTDLTVATHSPLGAQPTAYTFALDALKRSKCAFGLPQALVRKHTPGSRTGAHGRNR